MRSPLQDAARRGDLAEVRRLLDSGADVNDSGTDGATPLHWAASWGQDEIVKFLLERGANPHPKDDEGNTPLHLASRKGYTNTESVRRLLEAPGLDINAQTTDGNTALHGAALRGRLDVVQLLVTAGAEPTLKNGEGATAIDLALRKHRFDVAAFLRGRAHESNPG